MSTVTASVVDVSRTIYSTKNGNRGRNYTGKRASGCIQCGDKCHAISTVPTLLEALWCCLMDLLNIAVNCVSIPSQSRPTNM